MGSIGGHKLKVYHIKIFFFIPLPFTQLIGRITAFAQNWCPADLTVTSLSLLKSAAVSGDRSHRDATIGIYFLSLDR